MNTDTRYVIKHFAVKPMESELFADTTCEFQGLKQILQPIEGGFAIVFINVEFMYRKGINNVQSVGSV